MEPGDDCSYCKHYSTPHALSDKELKKYSVDKKHPNPSAITTVSAKRTCSVACKKLKLVLHNHRAYDNGGCKSFVEKSYGDTKTEKKSSVCWIATAYYGDPSHEKVCDLRDIREKLIKTPILGVFAKSLNRLYLFVGESSFGKRWEKAVIHNKKGIPNKVSGRICKVLLKYL